MIYKVMVSNLMVSWFAKLDDGIFCWSHRFSPLHGLVKQWSMLDVRTRTFTRRALPRIQLKAMGLDMQLDRLRRPGFWLGELSTLPGRVPAMVGIDDMNPIIKALLSTSQEVSFFGKNHQTHPLCARIKEGFLGNCYLPVSSAGLFCA